jgi:hypothetical protein
MRMSIENLENWIRKLSQTKPYRLMIKNGKGFYEIVFLYNEYHYSDKIYFKDMEDELLCQKKVLSMCSFFEENFKLRVF